MNLVGNLVDYIAHIFVNFTNCIKLISLKSVHAILLVSQELLWQFLSNLICKVNLVERIGLPGIVMSRLKSAT